MLNNLMKYQTEDIIPIARNERNLNFLNTISAFPADLRDTLSIVKDGHYDNGKTKYKFNGYSNYEISGTISDGTTGSEAIILNLNKVNGHESLPPDLVLKLMPIDITTYFNYHSIIISTCFRYSLNPSLVTSNPRYYHILSIF